MRTLDWILDMQTRQGFRKPWSRGNPSTSPASVPESDGGAKYVVFESHVLGERCRHPVSSTLEGLDCSDEVLRGLGLSLTGYCESSLALRLYRRRTEWAIMVKKEGVSERRLAAIRWYPCGVTPALLKRIVWGEVPHAEAVYAAEGQMYRLMCWEVERSSSGLGGGEMDRCLQWVQLWLVVASRVVPYAKIKHVLENFCGCVSAVVRYVRAVRKDIYRDLQAVEEKHAWKMVRDVVGDVSAVRRKMVRGCQRELGCLESHEEAGKRPRSEGVSFGRVECLIPSGPHVLGWEYVGREGEKRLVREFDGADRVELARDWGYAEVSSSEESDVG